MDYKPIDLAPPLVSEAAVEAVSAVLRSGWLTQGPRTTEFEKAFADYQRHQLPGVAVNSGTAALHLAMILAGIGSGDEVIIPALTFASAGEVLLREGATPVFAEVDPQSGNLSPAAVEAAITPKTKAVMPVHLGGYPAEMTELRRICDAHGLYLIDDCAHAVETRHRGAWAGSLADASAFSFYVNKNLTTGEGGMLLSPHEDWLGRVRRLRLHGMDHDAWNRYAADGRPGYDIVEQGYKYNSTDIASALGLEQLKRIEENYARRVRLATAYDEALSELPGIELPPRPAEGSTDRHAWHLYVIRVTEDCPLSRDELSAALRRMNTATAVHYHPMHLMRLYRERFGGREGQLPITERLSEERLTLPFCAAYEPETAVEVARRIKIALAE